MKKLIFVIILAGVILSLTPKTAEAGWFVGYSSDCYCCWGTPSPWDPWWECPGYWDVWIWCQHRPYWMWPWWARRWVSLHYSSCGRYYYTYYDYYVPGARRIYVDGRYRYRYSVQLDRTYSTYDRIPRRNGFERPVPEVVERTLASRGTEYRVRETPSEWTSREYREVVSRRSTSPEVSTTAPSHRSGTSPIETVTPDSKRSDSVVPSTQETRRSTATVPSTPSTTNRGTSVENSPGNIRDFTSPSTEPENITTKRSSETISTRPEPPSTEPERESGRTIETKTGSELKTTPPTVSKTTSRVTTESHSKTTVETGTKTTTSRSTSKSTPTSESSSTSKRSR